MKKNLLKVLLALCLTLPAALKGWTQYVRGKVFNQYGNEALSNVTVLIKGTTTGTYTNNRGEFRLPVSGFPVSLILSSIGYDSISLEAIDTVPLRIEMVPQHSMGHEVIISATRQPTRILESPVSIERYGSAQIVQSPAFSYYDIAAFQKGVDITTSSLTFKTISTRGFNYSGSPRVNQIVDGMDNQAPALNFFVGSFTGPTDLDVDNVEILPGASSALFGPGGMNGTILITSKDPFAHQGISFQARSGVMQVDKKQREKISLISDYSFRIAKAFNDRFAFKIGGQFIKGEDWLAVDRTNYEGVGATGRVKSGDRNSDPNYNGVNIYGDETSVDIRPFLAALNPGGVLPPEAVMVSRTGFEEKSLIDPQAKNTRMSGALHYRITPALEAIVLGNWSKGNTVYTSNNRYALKEIMISQYKFELKHRNWFIRSFTTQEDAGEAYTANITGQYLNEALKPSYDPANPMQSWYPQYTGAYLQARANNLGDREAHQAARAFADRDLASPGSAQFVQAFDAIRKTPIPAGGLFKEKSQLWMTELQYNFTHLVKFVDVIVGGNWKKYILDSDGTLFIDTAGPITIQEIGAYAQISKDMLNKRLNLSASGRWDKNDDFKPRFTPRFTALIRVAKNNNIRFSYQTAYRFASTQGKYIRLNVGGYTLLGGLPWIQDYMEVSKHPVHELVGGVPKPKPYVFTELKPESNQSFEIGYKALWNDVFMFDAYAYWGQYKDFLGRTTLYQPSKGLTYSIVTNGQDKVKVYGFGLGMQYKLNEANSLSLNAYSDEIGDVAEGFIPYFNTPNYRLNAGYINTGVGKAKKIGFGLTLHWQDAFFWEGEMASGPVNAFSTIDAQISYKFPALKSLIKLGGTNITNHYYRSGFGNPAIGAVYYISLGFGIL
ncbi:TonB-dependent receptor domain-containing protein [Flavihumibacter sp. ZG627]|uniref:TonB-dependent receptor n=1 Tax=Flavihumibacter sp. ZG627 TaxID=1463156 RepID=UPI00057CB6F7|nr:TonB-dependent receptor [Flavihumibacter sp. ZG627]KIC89969.1 hypothetical protein HY58_13225 [Flavihumibacter sp. ZG627]